MILSSISFAFRRRKAKLRSPLYPYAPSYPKGVIAYGESVAEGEGVRGDLIFDFRRRRHRKAKLRRGDLIFDFRRRRGDLSFAFLRRKAKNLPYSLAIPLLSFAFLWRCVPLWGKKGIGVILAWLSLHLTLWLDLIRYKVHRIAFGKRKPQAKVQVRSQAIR